MRRLQVLRLSLNSKGHATKLGINLHSHKRHASIADAVCHT
jgi:hypothetical protein